jgi:PilZ domain
MLTNFTERRKSERLAVRASAKILLRDSAAPLDCVVTNVSDGGARLHLRGADLPDVFSLQFADGKRRDCRVVWRQGAEIGVSFIDKPQVSFGRRIASP